MAHGVAKPGVDDASVAFNHVHTVMLSMLAFGGNHQPKGSTPDLRLEVKLYRRTARASSSSAYIAQITKKRRHRL
jgi:hypothetical protein